MWVVICTVFLKFIICITSKKIKNLLFITISVPIIIIILYVKSFNSSTWRGYISHEKWSLYSWINENINKENIIISSDIQDGFLLPVYQIKKPIRPVFCLIEL